MSKNVLQTIRSRTDSFSRGQKRIADYILMNYDKAAFMTAGHLGRKAQVSESTVVRFAAQLGYDGYPEMQKALQELIRGKLTSIQRIQVSRDQMSGADILGSVMQRDMNSIHNVIEQLDRDAFSRAVLAAVLLAMVSCSVLAVSFSSIFYILLSGAAGLAVYGVQQLQKEAGAK